LLLFWSRNLEEDDFDWEIVVLDTNRKTDAKSSMCKNKEMTRKDAGSASVSIHTRTNHQEESIRQPIGLIQVHHMRISTNFVPSNFKKIFKI